MLQNRVDPWGNIIRTSARGSWMGNRGLLHDENQNIRRPFKLQAWLICLLEFKGRKRPVMAPRQYTELFFMDEATAFSAGHRPCFECRRKDYDRFKTLWIKANPEYGFDEKTSIRKIDEILHTERIDPTGAKITHTGALIDLPDGSFVIYKDHPAVVGGSSIYTWSPFGYEKGVTLPGEEKLTVLTPKSVVNAFRAGYIPQIAAK
ncbi:MAG TPA: hypothetical protein VK518_06455 [Puia sp.]|nr:hypothetical protein [Puia sp.]